MINGVSASISGLSANYDYRTVVKGKAETDGVAEPGNGLQPEEYWTAERMRNVVAPDMGALKDPEAGNPEPAATEPPEGVVPVDMGEFLKFEVEPNPTNSGSVIAERSGMELYEYWTAERMRNVVAPDMGALKDPEAGNPEPEAKGVDLLLQYRNVLLSTIEPQSLKILA